ncbi:uncharacterized protein LOC106068974 isoform X1 [Biomphalaria glabrata]|uniref:Uncharacterized protein LOC106068974 isoform X1 n=2 Tax=Biomphalaria glabrata TaxID=6526 RepID=A0A9W2Z073_BIOGL|nr:uncharacterized protein LOC106068974 isoform X1 [Biomphalaria glabrata]
MAIFISLENLEKWKEENRCFFCKKKFFSEKVTCERCLEFQYCSIDCLALDRDEHISQCNLIGLRKGRCLLDGRVHFLQFVTSRAKLLDSEHNIRSEHEAFREIQAMKISRSSTNQIPRSTKERENKNPGHKSRSEYEAFRELQAMKTSKSSTDQIPRSNKKRKKNKKRKGHNATPQKNKPSSSTLKPDILHKNKQTPLNILNGMFGGAVRCSRTEQTGASFGKGWWKTGSESATALKNSTSPIVSCSSTKPPNRQKCSDFYPELQDDSRSRTDSAEHLMAKSQPETAASEMLDDANVQKGLADDNGHRKSLAKCGYCGKESEEMKTCSRCRMRSYCDRACQARDFAAHKQLCKRSERFQKVLKGLPLECKAKINNLSFNVTPENDTMLLKSSILVEITERLYLFFFYAVMAVDLSGKKIFLNLKFPRNYKWPTSKGSNGPIAMVTLHDLLAPGNFVLVYEPIWTHSLDGRPGVEVHDLSKVYFEMKGRL